MRLRHFIASLLLAGFTFGGGTAAANSINLVGTFGTKALVSINGSSPKKMAPGDKSPEGILLVSVTSDSATFEVDGQRRTLKMGQHYASTSSGTAPTVILGADSRGHFVTQGMINGSAATFMVDTGASMVAISAGDAHRMNIKYRDGEVGWVSTANGTVAAYRVRLDSVRVGAINLTGVDALITEAPMPYVLLGMSFLNRLEMKRSGEQMTLTRRY
ncbi:MAG TPA: TIGR02281 family clan AA aspartic protease [Burkholderiales bacterium]|nr:TIGR02281 family clan AA aspartic protease [Burkholderiales bacterium]